MRKTTFLLFVLLSVSFRVSFAQDWTYANSTGTTFILFGMSFPPGQNNIGYACGMQYTYDADGVIVKTVDGGQNWTQIWPASGTIDGLQGIWFISELVGFACGWNNYFIKTTDGGATWTPITVGSNVWYYTDVEFWDSNNGVATGSMNNPGDQAVFITSDGGNTWVPATSGVGTNEIMGLCYATQTTLYAVGTGAHVFKSTDGGHNWTTINTLSALLFGVDFADANFGVVGGEEKIFATNDGGATWTTFVTGYELFSAAKAFTDGTAYMAGTDENIYITTNFGQNWSMDFNGTGESHLYRMRFTPDGTAIACGSQGTVMLKEPLLIADFTASSTTVCTGGTVTFSDNSQGSIDSWEWVFEGGTPSTSTDQNPVVTYDTEGTYDVQLTITSGSNSNVELKADYISVVNTPGQAATPSGPAEVCGSYSYQYTTQAVTYATSYQWEVTPASAGTIAGNGITGTFNASNSWEGAYTIRVRAENNCGDGAWSPDFTGDLWHNPVEFELEGNGAWCEGSQGFELILDGSETGVDYEAFKDNVSTGIILPGTGSAISFGYFTESGLYSVEGFTAHCTDAMLGQIYVHQQPLPGQPALPQGPDMACNDQVSDYTSSGSANADDYTWVLDPAEAGLMTPNGEEVSIDWDNAYTGTAMLSLYGMNDCGDGVPSEVLEITVSAIPAPVVSGLALVCENDEADYSTPYNEGSSYTWEVTGGTVVSGTGTDQVVILWGTAGTGYVTVTELNAGNCEAMSESLEVVIEVCSGIEEGNTSGLQLYPNPAVDVVFVSGATGETVRVYDILGNEVLTVRSAKAVQIIELSGLEKGIYLVRTGNGEGAVMRLVKN